MKNGASPDCIIDGEEGGEGRERGIGGREERGGVVWGREGGWVCVLCVLCGSGGGGSDNSEWPAVSVQGRIHDAAKCGGHVPVDMTPQPCASAKGLKKINPINFGAKPRRSRAQSLPA